MESPSFLQLLPLPPSPSLPSGHDVAEVKTKVVNDGKDSFGSSFRYTLRDRERMHGKKKGIDIRRIETKREINKSNKGRKKRKVTHKADA